MSEEKLVVLLEAKVRDFEKNMIRASQTSGTAWRKIEKDAETSAARLAKTMAGASAGLGMSLGTKLLAAGGIALGTREIIGFSDAWTRANNSLKVAGLSGSELHVTLQGLFDAAQRQGAPLEALTTILGRAAQSAKELGATRAELLQFSEDVASALRVAGTSPGEASGALLQLSQLLGSARVQAEEFNSINEGARPILQAVANGIEEAGGSVSKLKALVTAGGLSNEAFFRGFQAGAAGLREQAATADATISQGFERISNAITKAVGELDKTSGASRTAVENLGHVADAIAAIPRAVDLTGNKLAELQNWLTSVGNNPFWEKLGRALGAQYTQEEAASLGITLGGPREQGIAALKAGQGTPLGNGFNVSDLTSPKTPTKTIRASDYPFVGAKEKAGGSSIDHFDAAVASLNRHTEALRLDADMAGKSTYETEKAHAAQTLLNAAKQQYGQNISPQVRRQIEMEAEAYGRAADGYERARVQQDRAAQVQQEFGRAAQDGIQGLIDGTQTWGDALGNIAKRLESLILQAALMGDGPFGSMFGASASGGKAGGLIGMLGGMLGFADGGYVRGPGTSRSDSIPAMLSAGEFVLNADATRKFGPLVAAMNAGKIPMLADGGIVGAPAIPSLALSGSPGAGGSTMTVTVAPNITVNGSAGTPEQNKDLAARVTREMETMTRTLVVSEMRKQMRPGGVVGR